MATHHPERVGEFRIRAVLGQGGMGVVYLAQQNSPQRDVALKLLKSGPATEESIRRFRLETEVLSRLQHPGIAQIFEAGTSDAESGRRPYFAMEFIDGRSLTDYAQAQRLSVSDRLSLLTRIAQSVHYAHQRGIIHRDLKPGNIIVNASGQPKILDFGVARATDTDVQITTMHSDVGQLIGTIPYMSPEQVDGDPRELDTRSDVYALGVIGYELLSGQLPHDLRHKAIPEAVRIIREVDPAPMSSINRTLRGDVETIINKAMEKDRTRRYQSASDFGDDITRYLRGDPITARPPSATYQFRKLVARHRVPFALIAALFVFVMGFGVWMSVLYTRTAAAERSAAAEAQTASQTTDFLVNLFQVSDPKKAMGNTITAREVLDHGAERIQTELDGQPLIQARLLSTMGGAYTSLGLYQPAKTLIDQALALRRKTVHGDHEAVAASLDQIGMLARAMGDYRLAEKSCREGLAMRRRLYPEDHPLVAESLQNVASAISGQGRYEEAVTLYREALNIRRKVLGPDHLHTAALMSNLAASLEHLEKWDEAEALFRESLAIHRRQHSKGPDYASVLYNLASLLSHNGHDGEAEELFRQAFAIDQSVFDDDHPMIANLLTGLGQHRLRQGRYAEALEAFRHALAIHRKKLGDRHPDLSVSLSNVAVALRRMGKYDEAATMLREALDIERSRGEDHDDLVATLRNLGVVQRDMGDFHAAEETLKEALALHRKRHSSGDLQWAMLLEDIGGIYMAEEDYPTSERYFRETLDMRRKLVPPRDQLIGQTLTNIAQVLTMQKKFAESETMYREAYDILREAIGENHVNFAYALGGLGDVLLDRGKAEEAEPYLRRAATLRERVLGADHWQTATARVKLGNCLTALGKYEEAEPLLVDSLPLVVAVKGEDSKVAQRILANIVEHYEKSGKSALASRFRTRLLSDSPLNKTVAPAAP